MGVGEIGGVWFNLKKACTYFGVPLKSWTPGGSLSGTGQITVKCPTYKFQYKQSISSNNYKGSHLKPPESRGTLDHLICTWAGTRDQTRGWGDLTPKIRCWKLKVIFIPWPYKEVHSGRHGQTQNEPENSNFKSLN